MPSSAWDYPAAWCFHLDPEITNARFRVYSWLLTVIDLYPPQRVKLEMVMRGAKVSRGTAIEVMRWLVGRGYVIRHDRDGRGVPRLTLAWALEESAFFVPAHFVSRKKPKRKRKT